MDKELESLRAKLLAKPRKVHLPFDKGLSTGSTLLNLACTGRPDVGFLPGHVYLLVGDTASGKTFLGLTCFAEAAANRAFKEHRLVYDGPEGGALMDWRKFFGKEMAKRVEAPVDPGKLCRAEAPAARPSSTIEEFYDNVILCPGPFVWLLDSMDALSSQDERKAYRKQRLARRSGLEAGGSYGDGKAKKNSSLLRIAHNKVAADGSVLIIVQQTRDNIGFDAIFSPKTKAGGRAPTFYACLELWSSVVKVLRKEHKGRKLPVGVLAKVRVKKNRVTGRDRTVELPIYYESGIDDVGSMVRFLSDWDWWPKGKGGRMEARELERTGTEEKLIQTIQEEGLEPAVKRAAAACWNQIEAECRVERKVKYK